MNTNETCDGTDWGPIVGCPNFDEFIGGDLSCYASGTDYQCRFDTSACEGIENMGELGTCLVNEEDVDENGCDDGFLTITWTGIWIWNEIENPSHADPEGLSTSCVEGGVRVIECPSQIKLPFFGFYNILATALLIAIVYFVLSSRKKKKN